MNKIMVNTKFDGGSIEIIDISNPNDIQLSIKADTNSNFRQWFYFQISNVKNQTLFIKLVNIEQTSYKEGWQNYKVCMSYDNKNWVRIPTTFDGKTLIFNLIPTTNTVYFAHFEPYPYQRHLELIGYASGYN